MKRADWIRNSKADSRDRLTYLADLILSEIEWLPGNDLTASQKKHAIKVLKSNRIYFEEALKPALIKMLQKIIVLGPELSIYSDHPFHDFLVLQLWKTGSRSYTFNVIFHPGPHGINCITTFKINAENPKLLEVSKMQGFVQNNDCNTSS